MNFKQSSCILVAGIGAILTACNNDNANTNTGAETTPPPGDPGGNPLYNAQVLVCQWRDVNGPNPDDSWLYEKRFCIESGACTADPAVYCAYNVDGPNAPLDAWEKYTAGGDAYGGGFAFWQGWCYETCPGPDGNHASGVYAGKRPSPSCGPEEVPYPYDGACSPEDDTGTPTTGTPTEGTGDPTSETGDDTDGGDTDTDGPFVETWLCSQFAAENCQTRTGNGINVDDEHCWSTSATPPDGAVCNRRDRG